MKKLMFIIGIMFSLFTVSASAGKSTDRATVHRRSNTTIGNSLQRSPAQLPSIDVIFDSDNLTIEIISSMDCEASISIYDAYGNLIDFSNSMNTILYLPETTNQVFYIRIESHNWYATATISV